MREIKFRAWESVNSGMHYVDLAFMTKDGNFILPIGSQDLMDRYTRMNLDAVKIMQYTGLKDKNGKEIYEGDIVDTGITDESGQVRFINGSFVVGKFGTLVHLYSIFENCEIIGNIYENQELLK